MKTYQLASNKPFCFLSHIQNANQTALGEICKMSWLSLFLPVPPLAFRASSARSVGHRAPYWCRPGVIYSRALWVQHCFPFKCFMTTVSHFNVDKDPKNSKNAGCLACTDGIQRILVLASYYLKKLNCNNFIFPEKFSIQVIYFMLHTGNYFCKFKESCLALVVNMKHSTKKRPNLPSRALCLNWYWIVLSDL